MTGREILALPAMALTMFAFASPVFGETVTLVCGDETNYSTYVINFDKNSATWKHTGKCPDTTYDVPVQITGDLIHFEQHFTINNQCGVPDPNSWYAMTIDRTTGRETGFNCSTQDGCLPRDPPPNFFGNCHKQEKLF